MFDESKHPRDKDGKFTDGNSFGGSDNGDKLLKAVNEYDNDVEKNRSSKHKLEKINGKNKYEHTPDIYYNYKKGYIAGAGKGNSMSFAQADNGACNPHYNKVEGYDTNCQTCVAVYIARRLGYNVRALPDFNNKDIRYLSYNTNVAYLDLDGWHPESDFETTNKQHEFLDKTLKNGEIYSVAFRWKDSKDGHIVVAEKDSQGKLFVYDPQNNKTYRGNGIKEFFKKTQGEMEYTNLTKVSMDEKFCDKVMKKVD